MKKNRKEADLEEVLNEIKRCQVDSIILFGSYARGEPSEDIDILVIAEKPLDFDFGEMYDIIVIPKDEIENNSRRFKYALKRDGKVVYGKNPFSLLDLDDPTLDDASGYLKDALEFMERGKKEKVQRYLGTAAEQMFHSVVELSGYLLEKENYPIPNNHPETLKCLRKIEEKKPEIKNISNLYQDLFKKFHVEVWYRGKVPSPEELSSSINEVKSLLDKVKSLYSS